MKFSFIYFVILLTFFSSSGIVSAANSTLDQTVLLDFYDGLTKFNSSFFELGWNNLSFPCDNVTGLPLWTSIKCSNFSVVSISMDNAFLSGVMPSALSRLTQLTLINLENNCLSGTIPTEFSALTNLVTLQLNNNCFTGSIPWTSLQTLTKLQYMGLYYSYFAGTISSFLGKLTALHHVDLSQNHLTGSIPTQIGNLKSLVYLDFNGNKMNGTIPSQITSLSNVSSLNLYNNFFSGTLPSNWNNMKSLTYLDFDTNYGLHGSIPPSLGSAPKLVTLYLYSMSLSGTLPTQLSKSKSLETIWLDTNYFTGTLPTEFGLITSLYYLALGSNRLHGTLPTELGNLPHLWGIDVDNNDMTGTFPSQYGNLQDLEWLYLDKNRFNGSLPTEFGKLSALTDITFFSNYFSGTVPSEFGLLSSLIGLDLDTNSFTGTLPFELGNLRTLQWIYIDTNSFSGSIPPGIWTLTGVTDLQLSLNYFSGTLPDMSQLSSLQIIAFYQNQFSGTIPTSIGSLSNSLTYLGLYQNDFVGTIPSELGLLSKVTGLYLHSNSLFSTIPTEIGKMTSLLMLWLRDNELTGSIPSTLGMLSSLTVLYLDDNFLNGTIPSELCLLTDMQFLYLQDNSLSGSLPNEFGNFPYMAELMIFSNQLTGTLPSEMSNYSFIETFYAQNNQLLTGLVPDWDSYPSLQFMDISNTQLVCNMTKKCSMSLLLYKGLANTAQVISQPPSIYMNTGLFSRIPQVQLEICPGQPACPVSYLPNLVVTATIQPQNFVKPNSLQGASVQSLQGVAKFSALQFVGTSGVPYYIEFSVPGLPSAYSTTFTIPPCSSRKANSVQDTNDIYNCVCAPGYYFQSTDGSCHSCGSGYYKGNFSSASDSLGFAACISCPLYQITNSSALAPPATSINDCFCQPSFSFDPSQQNTCTCPPGSYLTFNPTVCTACPADSYSDSYNVNPTCTSCSKIDVHRTTNGAQGQRNASSCVCQVGYYPSSDLSNCYSCQTKNSQCLGELNNGGSLINSSGISVYPGYWLTTDSLYFHEDEEHWFWVGKCAYQPACPGGQGSEMCAKGYTGPTCAVCEHGYGKLGSFQCSKCPNPSVSKLVAAIIIFIIFMICVFIVYSSYDHISNLGNTYSAPVKKNTGDDSEFEKEKTQTQRSGNAVTGRVASFFKSLEIDRLGLKIAITHLQILGFAGNFATEWPIVVLRVFTIPASVATVAAATDNIALSCTSATTFYTKTALYFITPFILSFGVFVGFALRAVTGDRMLEQSEVLFLRVKQGTLALLYLAHPGIVQGLMKSIDCYGVGTQQLVLSDATINCNSSSFLILRICSALYLVIYGFGGLMFVYYLLIRDGESRTFTFLTNGYKPSLKHWDLIITARKLILVVISIFAPPILQLFFSIWVLLISYYLISQYRPYDAKKHKKMEQISLWTLILTISCGMLYENGILNSTNTSNAGFSVAVLLIILNIVIIAGVLFQSVPSASRPISKMIRNSAVIRSISGISSASANDDAPRNSLSYNTNLSGVASGDVQMTSFGSGSGTQQM